jgi:hypothetical protein
LPPDLERRIDGIRQRLYDMVTKGWLNTKLSVLLPNLEVTVKARMGSHGAKQVVASATSGGAEAEAGSSKAQARPARNARRDVVYQEPHVPEGEALTEPKASRRVHTVSRLLTLLEAGIHTVHTM